MKEFRKILLIIFIVSLFLSLVGSVSYARNHEERLEQRELDRQAKRCEQVGNRIANRISRYEENRDSHVTRFDKFVVRLDEILADLTDAGHDIAAFSEHVDVLKAMIAEYTTAYDAFIASLLAAEGIVCEGSEGEYHVSLKAAREQLRMAWKKRQEIRKYYAQTIRKDIQELRSGAGEGEDE